MLKYHSEFDLALRNLNRKNSPTSMGPIIPPTCSLSLSSVPLLLPPPISSLLAFFTLLHILLLLPRGGLFDPDLLLLLSLSNSPESVSMTGSSSGATLVSLVSDTISTRLSSCVTGLSHRWWRCSFHRCHITLLQTLSPSLSCFVRASLSLLRRDQHNTPGC